MLKMIDMRLLVIGLLLATAGCRDRHATSDEVEEAAKKKVAAIAAGTATPDVNSTESRGADATAGIQAAVPDAGSIHPIDQIAQGRRYRMAASAIDRGDLATAEKIRAELATDPQYSSLASAIHGLLLIKQGKLDEAIRVAEEISTIPVMQAEAYVIAGEVYQRENRLTEATAAFENALTINPQDLRAHRWLGAIYYDTGAMRWATTHLRTAAELDPDDVNSLLLSAKIFQEYEQYQEAITDYQRLLQRSLPDELKLLTKAKLAECQIKLRRLDEAEQVLEGCPATPGIVASRAAIAEAKGELEAAVKLAQEALEHAPDNRSASLVLSRIYLSQRRWDDARQVLERMVANAPYDHEPRLLHGRALVGSGDRQRGETEIKRATELKNMFLRFADLHQEAIKKPSDVSIRISLGELAEKLGRPRLAENWYQAALGLEPGNQQAIDALAKLNAQRVQ